MSLARGLGLERGEDSLMGYHNGGDKVG
jgi:hypothetical protein